MFALFLSFPLCLFQSESFLLSLLSSLFSLLSLFGWCPSALWIESMGDGNPSIHELFSYYNDLYFASTLGARVIVEWSSSRMTSCGGTCAACPGGAIIIRLSTPLLSLRPFEETKDVLLHEMIHAEHFVQGVRDDDPGGHGTRFKAKMRWINTWTGPDVFRPAERGYRISITHSMIEELRSFQRHHWVCLFCGDFVQRSMNRPPQKADCRAYRRGGDDVDCGDVRCPWHVHRRWCGGPYTKIAGDEVVGKKGARNGSKEQRRLPAVVDLTASDSEEVVDLT